MTDHNTCRRDLAVAAARTGMTIEITSQPDHHCIWWEEVTCPHGEKLHCHPAPAVLQRWNDKMGPPPPDIACPRINLN